MSDFVHDKYKRNLSVEADPARTDADCQMGFDQVARYERFDEFNSCVQKPIEYRQGSDIYLMDTAMDT